MNKSILFLVSAFLVVGVLLGSACQQAPAAPAPKQEAQPKTAPVSEAKPTPVPPAPTAAKPAAAATPAAAAPQKVAPLSPTVAVKLGVSAFSPSDAGFLISLEKNYFREEGLNVEVVPFSTAGEMIAPLSTNQIDVGGGIVGAGLFNAIARDIPLKIVADKGSVPKGFGYEALVIRKDVMDSGAFKTDADLKGKNIAMVSPGNILEIELEMLLAKVGLKLSDVTMTTIPAMRDHLTALANKGVDATFFVEPMVSQAVQQGIAVRYKGSDEIYPGQQIAVVMYSPGFAGKTEAANRFMVGYLRGVRDYYDLVKSGKNKKEMIDILAKGTKITDLALFDRMVPVGLNPNGIPNTQGLASDVKWLIDKGHIKQAVDLNKIIDGQYSDYAVKRLGKY